ncbi:MAG TPA: peptide deformylase [Anaerovoracaceae bacterium]|nr:peptide deformylase [Anaerovoracaceae bacterium]
MVVTIILYGSSILRKHSEEVTEEDNILDISQMLFDTLKKAEGIGLSCPQINLLKRAFVIDTSPLVENDLSIERFEGVFINPVIIDSSSEKEIYKEGCLSFPGIYEDVSRPEKILIKYQNTSFNIIEEELDGIKARIFQHEFDHLEGILFIDKISLIKRKLLTGKLNKIKKLR